jgi:hypothetical protein
MRDIRDNNSPAHQRIQGCPHIREILEIITLLLTGDLGLLPHLHEILEIITLLLTRGFRAAPTPTRDIRDNNSPAHQSIQGCSHLREILKIITLLLTRVFRAAQDCVLS